MPALYLMYIHKRIMIIMTTTNYNVRLDKDLKDRAFSVFESYGLTPSQAIRLFLNQVADTNTVPLSFDYQPRLNAQTIAAIAEIANGKGSKYDNFDDLMEELKGATDEIH